MSLLYSFFVGLDAAGPGRYIEYEKQAIEKLSHWYGGCSATALKGGWKNTAGAIQIEPAVRFDVVQSGEIFVDAEAVALWLGKLFEQQEILVTTSLIRSASYSIPKSLIPANEHAIDCATPNCWVDFAGNGHHNS